jgi:hypothetical protein
MKKPDTLDASRFTDRHGTDETFCRPFVELRARTAGIKFMPELWRSHPHRQIALPFADKLCGAGWCGTVAIFSHARAGRLHDTQKIFPFTIHTPDTLCEAATGRACHTHGISRAGDSIAKMESVLVICPVASGKWAIRFTPDPQWTGIRTGATYRFLMRSGKEAALPPLPPLRTGHESFPSSGSSRCEAPLSRSRFT